MFKVGDSVILHGARGIILEIDEDLCHVVWEDYFVSWEKGESLEKADD
jgi:hypothetical protein